MTKSTKHSNFNFKYKKEPKKQKPYITISRDLFAKFTPEVSKIQPFIGGPTNGDSADASVLLLFYSIREHPLMTSLFWVGR